MNDELPPPNAPPLPERPVPNATTPETPSTLPADRVSNRPGQAAGPVKESVAMIALRVGSTIAILGVAIFVALNPEKMYVGPPKVILFILVAMLPGVLLATEVTTRFQLQLPGFLLTATGSVAVVFGSFYMLEKFSTPAELVGIYTLLDEENQPLEAAENEDVVTLRSDASPIPLLPIVKSNSVVVVFPQQIPIVTMTVHPCRECPRYRGTVSFMERSRELKLGAQLLPLE